MQIKLSNIIGKPIPLFGAAWGLRLTGFCCILISLYFIYRQLKTTKIQKTLIEEKQTEITDSINYAKKIQDALMISTVGLKELIPESFIFFKPKDIVSGDFYWVHKIMMVKYFLQLQIVQVMVSQEHL